MGSAQKDETWEQLQELHCGRFKLQYYNGLVVLQFNIQNAEKEPTSTSYSYHHSVKVIVALSTTKGEGSKAAFSTYIDVRIEEL